MIDEYIERTLHNLNFKMVDIIKDHDFKKVYANVIECRICLYQIHFSTFRIRSYTGIFQEINSTNDFLTCNEVVIKNIIE